MSVEFHVIIPARYASSRFPGKLLMDLGGMSVLERVYQQALKSKPKSITIATDHETIYDLAQKFGACVQMTQQNHISGTDRIAEVAARLPIHPQEVIVNVQGDEPLIAPALITQVANTLTSPEVSMGTLCWPIESVEQCQNPNVVKVVRDQNEHALYFSRGIIPASLDDSIHINNIFSHIGLYAYRAHFLQEIVRTPPCELELLERLEQLRVLWAGHKIKVATAQVKPLQDINTPSDLEKARLQVTA